MKILNLPEFFRIQSPDIYPPFKTGRYMEEYFYDFILKNIDNFKDINYTYIPVFWTNLQVSSDFSSKKEYYNEFLKDIFEQYKSEKFFTIVQHDDCVLLNIPKETIVFGACSGHIALPLIYEDINNTLENIVDISKNLLCSFIGSETHTIRTLLKSISIPNYYIYIKGWDSKVPTHDIEHYINITKRSMYTLAPRGYGRSSFRYFECFLLNTIPIYIYDDINWLPYQDIIDYSKFSIVLHESELCNIESILNSISKESYEKMLLELKNHKHFFNLEYMCEYIIKTLININNIPLLYEGKQPITFL